MNTLSGQVEQKQPSPWTRLQKNDNNNKNKKRKNMKKDKKDRKNWKKKGEMKKYGIQGMKETTKDILK